MENRVSVISIIVKDEEAAGAVNELLHEYRQYVIGRMGIPHRERGISIISVVLDAPGDATSSLSGKLGMLKGGQCENTDRQRAVARGFYPFRTD